MWRDIYIRPHLLTKGKASFSWLAGAAYHQNQLGETVYKRYYSPISGKGGAFHVECGDDKSFIIPVVQIRSIKVEPFSTKNRPGKVGYSAIALLGRNSQKVSKIQVVVGPDDYHLVEALFYIRDEYHRMLNLE